ncbi:MAG: shikimate dehydrogenase [Steroidobacteraceae bacterium]
MNNDTTDDRYAVVGYPIKQSRSPFIHSMFARQTGQQLKYQLLEVAPEYFVTETRRFFAEGGKGLNVTSPHKQAMFDLVKYRTPRADFAGAVNTVMQTPDGELLGDTTDGVGLLKDLRSNLNFELKDKRILLLGAGGAARGVIAPLLQQQPQQLVIANRNVDRATQLVTEFQKLGSLTAMSFTDIGVQAFDLIINATSASLHGEMPPLPTNIVDEKTLCYDMAYGKGDTVFTHWAKRLGAARAVLGWGMLVEQAAESFFLWRGVRPDTTPVLLALQNPPALSTVD